MRKRVEYLEISYDYLLLDNSHLIIMCCRAELNLLGGLQLEYSSQDS
jgi:hypothetical protein